MHVFSYHNRVKHDVCARPRLCVIYALAIQEDERVCHVAAHFIDRCAQNIGALLKAIRTEHHSTRRTPGEEA